MCGICGVQEPASNERSLLLRQMCESIRHRGPDSDGFFEDDAVGIGMRRLSIIDLQNGSQPVFDESRNIAAVFNGEIYNFQALRTMLARKGHRFRSDSDGEVIPHLYEEFGPEFPIHLRGMFAIALWDRTEGTLVLVRDRLGKKPLYYTDHERAFVFGSELKALLTDHRVEARPSEHAISQYLTYQYVPAPLSAIAHVHKLQPGHVLVRKDGRTSTRPYWKLEFVTQASAKADRRSVPDLAAELRTRIEDCVRVRLVSERPLGAFLSGGLDSSAIVAAMSRVSSAPIKTFSIGFEEESHNELPYARRVAQQFATDHHELIVRPDAADILPLLVRSFDEPFADASAIPSYYLAQMTREHVVVALNGDGGDEAFGGYLRYPGFLQAQRRQPHGILKAMLLGASLVPRRVTSPRFERRLQIALAVLKTSDPAEQYGRLVSYFRPEEKLSLLTSDFRQQADAESPYTNLQQIWHAHRHTDVVNRLLAIDTHTYLPGDLLPKVDITTMAVSLEARSPLLDHTLIEWAAGLPGSLKVRAGVTKYLMKEALQPWLDDDLIHRRKAGFGVPLGDWFRGPLREMVSDILTDQTAQSRGWFNVGAVRRLIDEHMRGVDHAPQLYALLVLELWHRQLLDDRTRVY